jgi:hypothetical protein
MPSAAAAVRRLSCRAIIGTPPPPPRAASPHGAEGKDHRRVDLAAQGEGRRRTRRRPRRGRGRRHRRASRPRDPARARCRLAPAEHRIFTDVGARPQVEHRVAAGQHGEGAELARANGSTPNQWVKRPSTSSGKKSTPPARGSRPRPRSPRGVRAVASGPTTWSSPAMTRVGRPPRPAARWCTSARRSRAPRRARGSRVPAGLLARQRAGAVVSTIPSSWPSST